MIGINAFGSGTCAAERSSDAAVTSRRRRTPRLAPHSGSSLEHALNERGCERSSTDTLRSQERSWSVVTINLWDSPGWLELKCRPWAWWYALGGHPLTVKPAPGAGSGQWPVP